MLKWIAALGLVAAALSLAVVVTYLTVPDHNCGAQHFDTLIVLGCPPDPDGTASSEERARVMEAVKELRAGRSAYVVVTGGSPHSRVPEAEVMAGIFGDAGVSADSLLLETKARNTVENILYSEEIMKAHSFKSAEVISSPSHLPRTALLLARESFCWRTHASAWPPEYSSSRIGHWYLREMLGTAALRWFGLTRSGPWLPGGSKLRTYGADEQGDRASCCNRNVRG